jgi:hypothetical protein
MVPQNVAKTRGGYYEPPPEVPARLPTNIKAEDGAPPVKQIRDKHREQSYKALGEYYTLAQRHSTTSQPLHSIYSSYENE